MKHKIVKFLVIPLILVTAALPILCCCQTSEAAPNSSYAAVASTPVNAPCHSQPEAARHDNSECDCFQHSLKMDNSGYSFAFQDFSRQLSFTLHESISTDLAITPEAFGTLLSRIHYKPDKSAVPLYTKHHSLRI